MNEYVDPTCLEPKTLTLQEAVSNLDDLLSRPFDTSPPFVTSYDTYKARASCALEQKSDDILNWLIDNHPRDPDGFPDYRRRQYLADACISLIHAQRAVERGELDVAWYFISESNRSIGMADGDYSATHVANRKSKGTSTGGRVSAAPVNKAKLKSIYLLSGEKPPGGWRSHSAAVETIGPKLQEYIDAEGIASKVGDVYAMLLTWLDKESLVAAAYKEAAEKQKGG